VTGHLRDHATVRRWMTSVDSMYHLSDFEWAGRLCVLEEFCAQLAQGPDDMIAGAAGSRAAKNDYLRRLKRFASLRYPGARAAHDAENVVRSFLIHNGARVFVRPYD
jgi:hypothetical protein